MSTSVSSLIWFNIAFLLLCTGFKILLHLFEEWLWRRRWKATHLTLGDLQEIRDDIHVIAQYVDNMIDLGWTMVSLGPARYGANTDVSITLTGTREHTRNIYLVRNDEKIQALYEVYLKEWRETSSLLIPELRIFYHWCRKNVRKTIRAHERGEGEYAPGKRGVHA